MTPTEAVDAAFARLAADGRAGIWITVAEPDAARRDAAEIERRLAAGAALPLAGRTLAVKDNIDVTGLPTTAGCASFRYLPDADAPVVAALRAAGAVVIGKTNMDQFATGLVGTRSPTFGICPNAHWPGLVSGGSSSGSAVAVATGIVDLALGTDTAGSGRVPAACNGIAGLKPTRGTISNHGVVPACRSLDCVSLLARTIDEVVLATELAMRTTPDARDPWSRTSTVPSPGAGVRRVGVPRLAGLDLDAAAAAELARFAQRCAELGFDVVEVDLGPFLETASLLYGGAFVAERYDAVGPFVEQHLDDVDPTVAGIITAAGTLPAWQVFRDQTRLEHLRRRTAPTWEQIDVLVVPSVPHVPTVDEVLADPLGANARLGTYTNFVNLLDLCALTVPASDDEAATATTTAAPPFSVTFVAPAWCERRLVTLARQTTIGTLATPRTR